MMMMITMGGQSRLVNEAWPDTGRPYSESRKQHILSGLSGLSWFSYYHYCHIIRIIILLQTVILSGLSLLSWLSYYQEYQDCHDCHIIRITISIIMRSIIIIILSGLLYYRYYHNHQDYLRSHNLLVLWQWGLYKVVIPDTARNTRILFKSCQCSFFPQIKLTDSESKGKDSHTALIVIHLCADLRGKFSRLICLKSFFLEQNIELWPHSTLAFLWTGDLDEICCTIGCQKRPE